MSVSSTSSPYSASSPQALAPANSTTVLKPLAPTSGALQTSSIVTKKEWVVPPRPKPGRKPAADTPPTKRKAQNRAAQRAFRERRAARVGDLEEQMKQMEEQDEKEQADLRSRVKQLETDVDNYNHLLVTWREKYQTMETRYERERRYRESAERKLEQFIAGRGTDAVPLPPRNAPLVMHDDVENQTTPPEDLNTNGDEVPMGCGGCSRGSRCECIEQAFSMTNITTDIPLVPSKRPLSPLSTTDSKRSCHGSEAEQLEIDFTAQFSARRPPPSLLPVPTVPDPCGFCQDGTPCICAEMAAEVARTSAQYTTSASHPPVAVASPIPMASSIPTKLPSAKPSNPCVNGPGTCAQCLISPDSTLFCKSLAATRSKPSALTNPDFPSSTAPTTTTTIPSPSNNNPNNSSAVTGVTLSCAATFETLSRHPAFDRASEELGAWMPKLTTVPGGVERTAFEVEAASVMGVLRFFDRRFGREV